MVLICENEPGKKDTPGEIAHDSLFGGNLFIAHEQKPQGGGLFGNNSLFGSSYKK